jgi:hypothetical protein
MRVENEHLRPLLDALRNYKQAAHRYEKAIPSPYEALSEFRHAFNEVLAQLHKKETRGLIEKELNINLAEINNINDFSSFLEEFFNKRNVSRELSLGNNFGMSRNESEKLVKRARVSNTPVIETPTLDVKFEAIVERFELIHSGIIVETEKTRTMGKKEKRRRKRDIRRAMASSVFGIGIIAVNTQMPATFVVSYGLAAAPLHQALRDIIGDQS